MAAYTRIGLTCKHQLTEKEHAVQRVVSLLQKSGVQVFADRSSMDDVSCVRSLPALARDQAIDALVVMGGDGTILRSVRELQDFSIPLIAINRGNVGFLAELTLDDIERALPPLLAGQGIVEERSLLTVSIQRGGEQVFHGFALNESAISQGAISRLLDLRTSVNGHALATYHADGLIVATPTGSTAYSLAAGGPVVHPRLHALILTPINPHSLTQKPIVLPGESVVEAEVLPASGDSADVLVSLTLDGQIYQELQRNDIVTVRTHAETVKFLRSNPETFFHTLRTKLRWGERL